MHCWHGPSVYPFFHSSLLSGSRHEDAGCWGRSRASAVAVRWVDCARLRGPDRHVWCMYSIQSCHRHHHQEYRQHVKWWVVTAEHSTFYSDELMSYIHTYTHSYFVRFDARAWWTRCNIRRSYPQSLHVDEGTNTPQTRSYLLFIYDIQELVFSISNTPYRLDVSLMHWCIESWRYPTLRLEGN